MKLISLNIWLGNLLLPTRRFLQSEQADIMCLQEVYSSDIEYPLFEAWQSLEFIKADFPEYHVYFSPIRELRLLGGKLELGKAILSRFPITQSETIFVNGEFKVHDKAKDLVPNTRNLQIVTLDCESRPLHVMNHHAYWDRDPMGNEISAQKMQLVADKAKQVKHPLILAGDFNLKSVSPALRPVQELLTDLTQKYQLASTLSQFGKVADVDCDHVFVSDDITVKNYSASDTLVSDHKPLILEFDL